jgi:diguanylate cyclase (GGDEF)-like protein
LAGDAALCAVATALRTVLPAPAIVCRYGGEEFAALVPGANAERMVQMTALIRTAIADAKPDPSHPERTVTASLGWTLLHDDEPGRTALARADQACYRAKSNGRNRVEAAP